MSWSTARALTNPVGLAAGGVDLGLDEAGRHRVQLRLAEASGKSWQGKAESWLSGRVALPFVEVTWRGDAPAQEAPMPPRPWPEGEFRRQLPVGEATVSLR